jgi:hypothetical protein
MSLGHRFPVLNYTKQHSPATHTFTNPVITTSQTFAAGITTTNFRQITFVQTVTNMSIDARTSHSFSSSSRPSRFHEEMSYNMSNSRENDHLSDNHCPQSCRRVAGFEDFVHPSKLSTMKVEDERAEKERVRMKEKAKGMVRGLSFKRT